MLAFTPPWNDSFAEGCLGQDDEKVRPAPPANAHANSLKTTADFPEEVEKRAKAKANREAKASKKKLGRTKKFRVNPASHAREEGTGFRPKRKEEEELCFLSSFEKEISCQKKSKKA